MTGRIRLTIVAAVATYLATFALWPLFQTSRWPYLALLVVALMAGTGWMCRRLRVPAALATLAAAVVLLLTITVLYARKDAFFFLLPTRASLSDLGGLLTSALIDIRRYATPAPESTGLMLLTVSGIGLVAGLVDLVAVRLRHPALAGLPMLALFSVSAGILKDGPGWLPFLLGAVGYLALLLSESRERLARWGRPVLVRRPWERYGRSTRTETTDTTPIASIGRRIGFATVLVAVLAPAFIPLTDHSFAGGNGPGSSWLSRFGAPTLRAPDPIVSMRHDLLRQSDRVFLRYKTTSRRPDYLRMVALTEFDGESWHPPKLRGFDEDTVKSNLVLQLPASTDLTSMTTVKTTVDVTGGLDLDFLPAPYAPKLVDARGGWYYDPSSLTLFAPNGVETGRSLHYTVVSEVPHPRPTALQVAQDPSVLLKPYLELPADLPDEVRQTAQQVADSAETAYQKAVALQEWFTGTGGFTYSTDVPGGTGNDALLAFLHGKRGFCEQFASAMAVMARTLGIPSRVAVGFTQGTQRGDQWVVRGSDAHAWPELWFENVGWVRFEPTPNAIGDQASAIAPGYTLPGALETNPTGNPEPDAVGVGTNGPSQSAPDLNKQKEQQLEDLGAQGAGPRADVGADVRLALLILLLVVLALGSIPLLARTVVRRRPWARARSPAARAHAAWNEVRDIAADLGMPVQDSQSPRGAGERLQRQLEPGSPAAQAARRVALAEERARYAPRPDTPAGIRADVAAVRAGLAHTVPKRQRVRAQLLPRSVAGHARAFLHRAGRRYEEMDLAVDRVLGRLVPRRLRSRSAPSP